MSRPNILILYTDQQRYDALGAQGNPDIRTPHLDGLAAQAVRFDQAFVQCPVCMPSRISFLTGQYPGTLGILHMGVPVPEETLVLPKLLKPYGYRSANLGKLHFLPHADRDHRRPHPSYGFDQWEISDEPGCYEDAYFAWVRRRAPEAAAAISCGLPPARALWQQAMGQAAGAIEREGGRDEWVTRAFAAADDLTHTAFVAERTLDFLDRVDSPFLCIAGFYSPHSPWIAPQRWLDLYDPSRLSLHPADRAGGRDEAELRQAYRGYYAMISEVDHHIGRILGRLEARGLAENTVVVFTSDHGEWLGRHGRFGKGYPGADAASRVPLLLRIPGRAAEKRMPPVEAVDVVPTLLEAVGAPVPPHLQGRSLLADRPDDHGALTEQEDWKAIRLPGWRYLVHADGRERLWNLDDDPDETRDGAVDPACRETLAYCRHRLLQRLLARERPHPKTWTY